METKAVQQETLIEKDKQINKVVDTWYRVRKDGLSVTEFKEIIKDLTLQPKTCNFITKEPDPSVELYCLEGDFLCILKSYGFKKFGIPDINNRNCGKKLTMNFVGTIDKEKKQDKALESVLHHLSLLNGGYRLALPPRDGKTVVCLKVLSELDGPSVI
jgi:hypothetical protein